MTEPLKPTYHPRSYLSVSTLLSFIRCPRLYFYKKCGLQQDEFKAAPQYGTAMHKAIPVALATGDYQLSGKEFLTEWDESNCDDKRNMGTALRSIKHFVHTHTKGRSLYTLLDPPEGSIKRDDSRSPWEVAWAIDIGLRVPLVGVFDGFCTHRDLGGKWIWELKTASRVNDLLLDQFDLNFQVLTYAMVGQTLLSEPIDGVMVECILVDKSKVDNHTQPVPVQQHHIEAVLKLLQYKGAELLAMEDKALEMVSKGLVDEPGKVFIQDFSHCTAYSHYYMATYSCDYKELCRPSDWRDMAEIFSVVPDHDFINLTINKDAIKPAISQPV